jgi:hypothetical protein
LDPLKHGTSGWIIRAGGTLSGPIPLALRTASLFGGTKSAQVLRRWAAASAIVGSLITRFAWIHAGHVSARDWKLPLQGSPASRPRTVATPPARDLAPKKT